MIEIEDELRAALREGAAATVLRPDAAAAALRTARHTTRLRRTAGTSVLALLVVATAVTVGVTGRSHPRAELTVNGSNVPAHPTTARQEASRLRDLVQLPSGSTLLSSAPADLSHGPVSGTPSSRDWIDVPRYARVPLSSAASFAYLATHGPGGLSAGGVETVTTNGLVLSAEDFGAPSARLWTDALVEVGVERVDQTTSLWRVDGEAIAVDPTPIRVRDSGPTLRVTVAGGCPTSDRIGTGGGADVGNPDAGGLDSAMLPSGTPTAARICRYDGLNGHAFGLVAQARASSPGALAGAVQDTYLGHFDAVVSCPADDGRAVVMAFSYPGRPDVDVELLDTGCASIDNGIIRGTPSATVEMVLAPLVGPRSTTTG